MGEAVPLILSAAAAALLVAVLLFADGLRAWVQARRYKRAAAKE